jgi:glycosyltransferase involved in cell wall biosynthesis
MTLKIAINAQLLPGNGAGGTECLLIGLVNALGRLDGPEQYLVVGPWEHPDWLKSYLGQNQSIVRGPKAPSLKRALGPLKPLLKKVRGASSWVRKNGILLPWVEQSNGFYESLDCSVIHFPYQQFVTSGIPSVFHPHDLQHLHFPQFFPAIDVERREVTYRAACRAAHTIVVHSNWVKQDIVTQYKLQPRKVQVILAPPPVQAYAEPTAETLDLVRRTYKINSKFAFYPAVTWEHKNHLRLLDALALLHKRGIKIELICTGYQTDFFPRIQNKVSELQLNDQVRFLGMIPAEHLRAIYRLAHFTVFPTLFEGAGLPLVEAWTEGSPITCSAVTSLIELAEDGALLFDPNSVESIAEAVTKMVSDVSLRKALIERGLARLNHFSWEIAAKAYRAVYRRAAGYCLSDEDQWLLNRGEANHADAR